MTVEEHDTDGAGRGQPVDEPSALTQPREHQSHGGALPVLDIAALTVLCRAANLVRHHLDTHVLYDAHLNWTSWDILQLIVGQPGILTRQIAAAAAVSKSAVTLICNGLVDRDLIRRRREGAGDKRLVRLYPTARASQLVDDLLPQLADTYERYIGTGRSTVDNAFRALLRDLFLPATDPADDERTEPDEG
jgi:DNA-binding MarR family transcriptional regulator